MGGVEVDQTGDGGEELDVGEEVETFGEGDLDADVLHVVAEDQRKRKT